MMYEAIKNFHTQFEYEPKIENPEKFKVHKRFIVAGMGGSHLAGDLLKAYDPSLDITIHMDYDLPQISEEGLRESLIIASSYSGNTEETISAFEGARERSLDILVISTGGKLIELAQEHATPYIKMPDTGIQPRSALGFSFAAMLKATGSKVSLKEFAGSFDPESYKDQGGAIAKKMQGKVPVIYSSSKNRAIAYNWKIKLNETGKIPSFYNVFPELNHNEMTGFDVGDATKKLSENFYFLILHDSEDDPRIKKRMKVLAQLYRDRGLLTETVEIEDKSRLHKMFASLILADWIAYYTAEQYGLESEQVPMVEEFKKLVS